MADGKEWTTANLNVEHIAILLHNDAEDKMPSVPPHCCHVEHIGAAGVPDAQETVGAYQTDDEWRQMAKQLGGIIRRFG